MTYVVRNRVRVDRYLCVKGRCAVKKTMFVIRMLNASAGPDAFDIEFSVQPAEWAT